MFLENQTIEEQNRYEILLRIIGSLSKLSSENGNIPYLYYRMAENVFCRAFSAKNLSRSDISIDASKSHYGIGLKTFLHRNGHCLEKVAEFNKERKLYSLYEKKPEDIIKLISEYRNKRIISTCGICSVNVENLLYHCVSRKESKFCIHETPISLIDSENINIQTVRDNTILFNDNINEYCFNLSKSTLFKRFDIEPIFEIDVNIIEDPFELLEKYLSQEFKQSESNKIVSSLCLPLYSERGGIHVPLKSGLNQWNADGRKRNPDEVYIPIPSDVRNSILDFFPARDESFTLHLPTGNSICAKVCQENGKALMSNPNQALGKWILRDVLRLKPFELATYEKLEEIGIDSVEINKYEDNTYEINFKELGTYESFKNEILKANQYS